MHLWDALSVRGDLKEGREVWSKIWLTCKFLDSHNYPSAIKTGLELLGQETGRLRKPFALLGGSLKQELRQLMESAGLKIVFHAPATTGGSLMLGKYQASSLFACYRFQMLVLTLE